MNKLTYSVEELSGVLGISIVTAYELARRADFPKIRVGRRILVPINELNRWLEKESNTVSPNCKSDPCTRVIS